MEAQSSEQENMGKAEKALCGTKNETLLESWLDFLSPEKEYKNGRRFFCQSRWGRVVANLAEKKNSLNR